MDRTSYFIENKALFGSYPNNDFIQEYENNGIRHFIDLTEKNEKGVIPYKTSYNYIHYPIQDQHCPSDWKSFACFIVKIGNLILNLPENEKVLITCRGGHGRSGVVVASLFCYLYKMNPVEALAKTSICHSKRVEMKEKWRKIGSPQTRQQKNFVMKFFEPLYMFEPYSDYFTKDFDNDSKLRVEIPGFGLFSTANAAYQAFKDPYNNQYVKELELETSPEKIEKISKKCSIRTDWNDIKEYIMYKILQYKFHQHPGIYRNLLSTGLRPIMFCRDESVDRNTLVKLLDKTREKGLICA